MNICWKRYVDTSNINDDDDNDNNDNNTTKKRNTKKYYNTSIKTIVIITIMMTYMYLQSSSQIEMRFPDINIKTC